MKKTVAASLLLWLAASAGAWPSRTAAPPQFSDERLFPAISGLPAPDVQALVVPHHLLATDLIARGFGAARSERPDRIVVLGPDHFRRGRTQVSVNLRDLDTCFGRVPADLPGAAQVLADRRASTSTLFGADHAFGAVIPYVARLWPGVPVLAVAIGARARQDTWHALADRLAPLVGPRTLIVVSSDFSHYLPTAEADTCDARTLEVLRAGDPAGVSTLGQPRHSDCRGALYVTMALCGPAFVIERRNSAYYAGRAVASSTSYMVLAFRRRARRAPAPKAARSPSRR